MKKRELKQTPKEWANWVSLLDGRPGFYDIMQKLGKRPKPPQKENDDKKSIQPEDRAD